jgi:hypothetical protein
VGGIVPPAWLDVDGRRCPTLAWWTCGRCVSGPPTLSPSLGADPDATDPGLVRLFERVPAGANGRRLVVARPDLGPDADAESAPPVGTTRPVLGARSVILRSATAIRARAPMTMPHERVPDLPRVVVARIKGRDTLYEFDLTATPSPAWRAVFSPATARPHDRQPYPRHWPRCDSRAHGAFPRCATAPGRLAASD